MIAILGAGAFGTSLSLAIPGEVRLWGRGLTREMRQSPRLPGHALPDRVRVMASPEAAINGAAAILIAVPMGALRGALAALPGTHAPLVACCKGLDAETGLGPASLMAALGWMRSSLLTGPSFAIDVARGLPTALTLASHARDDASMLQQLLSSPTLRVYTTDDVKGAELGGALKNVLAIASGAVTGAGLGASAQAALITRGLGELALIARLEGAQSETLMGLSGLGDLMLTALSESSRNYRYGLALGRGQSFAEDTTVEGVATAAVVADLARKHAVETPVLAMTQRLISGDITIHSALEALMSRPLKEE
ncbi:MAG: NAD(P)H-dependent glycerol-3-phosphate dehydrogenase [Pseudomonadota bacterium]